MAASTKLSPIRPTSAEVIAPQPTKTLRAVPNMAAQLVHGGLPLRFREHPFLFHRPEGEKEVTISRHGFHTSTVLGALGISISKVVAAARYYCRSKPDAMPADVYRNIDLIEWMPEETVQHYCINHRSYDDFEEAGWQIFNSVIVEPRPELHHWAKTARLEAARINAEMQGAHAPVKDSQEERLRLSVAKKLAHPDDYPSMSVEEAMQPLDIASRTTITNYLDTGKLERFPSTARGTEKKARVLIKTHSVLALMGGKG
jgi:hypothetical protein